MVGIKITGIIETKLQLEKSKVNNRGNEAFSKEGKEILTRAINSMQLLLPLWLRVFLRL